METTQKTEETKDEEEEISDEKRMDDTLSELAGSLREIMYPWKGIREHYSTRPLHYVALYGNGDIAKALISMQPFKKEIMDVKDRQKYTPLLLAVECKNVDVIRVYLREADVNAPGGEDRLTALHAAAQLGCTEIIEIILQHPAVEINVEDANKETPLHKAVMNNNKDCVRILLEKGATVDCKTQFNIRPTQVAAREGHVECLIELVQKYGDKPLEKDAYDTNILMTVVQHGNARHVKVFTLMELVQKYGDKPLEKDAHDTNILMTVVQHGNARHVKFKNIQQMIDDKDNQGNTAVHYAAGLGFQRCLKILMKSGADVNLRNNHERTAIHLAAYMGHLEELKLLVSEPRGLIDAKDRDGNTALHLAAENGHHAIVKFLINANATLNSTNEDGFTALQLAAKSGYPKACYRLMNVTKEEDRQRAFYLACENGCEETVHLFMTLQSSPDWINPDTGLNCLDVAIREQHRDIVMKIIRWNRVMNELDTSLQFIDRATMHNLVKKLPEIALEVMDECLREDAERCQHDFKSVCDSHTRGSRYLEYEEESDAPHPVKTMIKEHRLDLLKHATVESWMAKKRKVRQWFYYLHFLIHLWFAITFSGFLSVQPMEYAYGFADLIFNDTNRTGFAEEEENGTTNATECDFGGSNVSSAEYKVFVNAGRAIIITVACLKLLLEVGQLVKMRKKYFIENSNWLEVIMYVGAIVTVIDLHPCPINGNTLLGWQRQIGALVVVLVWLETLLLIQHCAFRGGLYVIMIFTISSHLLVFIPICFVFLLGFTLAFYVLLPNQVEFSEFGIAMLKCGVMMFGEFDFGDIFLDGLVKDAPYEDILPYPPATYILFCCFAFLMSLVIFNTLLGIALDDIRHLMENAEFEKIQMEVNLIYDTELTLTVIGMLLCSPCIFGILVAEYCRERRHNESTEELVNDIYTTRLPLQPDWLPYRRKKSVGPTQEPYKPMESMKLLLDKKHAEFMKDIMSNASETYAGVAGVRRQSSVY